MGYRLFNSSRDFSDSLGRGEPVLLTQGFGLALVLDLIPIFFEINEL